MRRTREYRTVYHKRTHTPQWRIVGRLLIDLFRVMVWYIKKWLRIPC